MRGGKEQQEMEGLFKANAVDEEEEEEEEGLFKANAVNEENSKLWSFRFGARPRYAGCAELFI